MKTISAVTFLLLSAFGCATVQPANVPLLAAGKIPKAELPGVQPRVVQLKVRNLRKINEQAGNSDQVAEAVEDALADALSRGGVTVGESKNNLDVAIEDCKDAPAKAICVRMSARLSLPKREVTSAGTQGYSRDGVYIEDFGNVSEVYAGALEALINGLNAQTKKTLGE